jgi:putative IMPACT (imprinted ancient) family translation regulator
MDNLNSKNIIEIITKGGISAVLLVIILYFGGTFLSTLQEMQKDLAQIRIEITKVQSTILTPEQVEKMIDAKIKLLEYKFHSKECDTLK